MINVRRMFTQPFARILVVSPILLQGLPPNTIGDNHHCWSCSRHALLPASHLHRARLDHFLHAPRATRFCNCDCSRILVCACESSKLRHFQLHVLMYMLTGNRNNLCQSMKRFLAVALVINLAFQNAAAGATYHVFQAEVAV